MDQDQLFRRQQEQYNAAATLAAQVADLTTTFLHKRVRAAQAGMLTRGHKKKFSDQTGIVNAIVAGQVAGLEVAWEDGSTTNSLPYMVEVVTCP